MDILAQALTELHILQENQALLRLGMAAFCGFLIGIEREHAAKPAGVRTNMLICVGSALFTLASLFSWKYLGAELVDPTRIAAQIVSGVGFLGAGVIVKTGFNIIGITTASTIWLVSAIGMVIGLGFPLLGLLVTLAATLTLFLLGRFEFSHWPPTPRYPIDKEELSSKD